MIPYVKMMPYVNEYDTPECKTLAETAKKSIRTPESLGLDRCIQCGACTASCPAARFTDYSPRQIVKKVLENDRSVLESEMIWSCFYCYSCNLRCPRNNSPVTIVQVLRQMAINEGIGVEKLAYFLEIGEHLGENGASKVPGAGIKNMERDLGERWIGIKRKLEPIRSELGLSARDVRNTHGEVQAILESTGYFEREKWIKARVQEKRIHGFMKTDRAGTACTEKTKNSGDFGLESDREYTGQEALTV